jgi:hypothetical protein
MEVYPSLLVWKFLLLILPLLGHCLLCLLFLPGKLLNGSCLNCITLPKSFIRVLLLTTHIQQYLLHPVLQGRSG